MDIGCFDRLTLAISNALTRRGLVTALGLGSAWIPGLTGAKKKGKNKKRTKIKRNEFGCVNVGNVCKKDAQCCSGICKGRKGNKKCKAHDTGGCQPSDDICLTGLEGDCTTGTDEAGACVKTTGKAGYCFSRGDCFPCRKDADCVPLCGPQAACIVCVDDCGDEFEGTACVGPSENSCVVIEV
jgi:hypothetical protein